MGILYATSLQFHWNFNCYTDYSQTNISRATDTPGGVEGRMTERCVARTHTIAEAVDASTPKLFATFHWTNLFVIGYV